jgi:hypothetical protein
MYKVLAEYLYHYHRYLDSLKTQETHTIKKEKKPPKKYTKLNSKMFVQFYHENEQFVLTLMSHLKLDTELEPKKIYSTYLMRTRDRTNFNEVFYNEMLSEIVHDAVERAPVEVPDL